MKQLYRYQRRAAGLLLCLLLTASLPGAVFADEEEPLSSGEPEAAEETADEPAITMTSGAAIMAAQEALPAEDDGEDEPEQTAAAVTELLPALDGVSDSPFRYSSNVVQEKIYAMQALYPDKYPWNDNTWYYSNVFGNNPACVGFAYMISDAAFDDLPVRIYKSGSFTFDDIHVGDILYEGTTTYSHAVVVQEKFAESILVVQGNIKAAGFSSYGVLWGKNPKSISTVMDTYHMLYTRYPLQMAGDPTGDKLVDEWDAAYVTLSLVGIVPESKAADANGDGTISSYDVAYILRYMP